MRSRVMRRRMHRVLWKKLSRIYTVDMAEVLGWIAYISIVGIFQCFCIVIACEQRDSVNMNGQSESIRESWLPMIRISRRFSQKPTERTSGRSSRKNL